MIATTIATTIGIQSTRTSRLRVDTFSDNPSNARVKSDTLKVSIVRK
jgi:hypothetical protein